MNSLDHVENLIIDNTEGYFDDSDSRENLHIPLRIASDFYKFLVKFGDQPPTNEVDYMMGTIRSGFDWFFALAYQCGVVAGSENWRFNGNFDENFPALRAEFLSSYERLAKNPGLSAERALEALLYLTRLEFMFVAQHFPSALFVRT